MNADVMNNTSKTDWARIDEMSDKYIDTSDIPPLSDEFFHRRLKLYKSAFGRSTINENIPCSHSYSACQSSSRRTNHSTRPVEAGCDNAMGSTMRSIPTGTMVKGTHLRTPE
ncbi:hypothetical protein [Microcoleus asticus]|uniref:hypothetical protein n=1 Tax=Microcoleus asticus TaxID=2815231 RepID=UPI001C12E582|nr:hypothetical protein [Microcoleus asticus]